MVVGCWSTPLHAAGAPSANAARLTAVRAVLRGDATAVLKALEGSSHRGQASALLRAWAHERLGRGAQALVVLTRASTRGLLGEHLLQARAALLARLGQSDRAAADYAELQRSRAATYADHAALARAPLLLGSGRARLAAGQYRLLGRRFPNYPDPAAFVHGEALALKKLGRPRAAAALWRRLVLRHPAAVDADAAGRSLEQLRRAGISQAPFTVKERTLRALRLGRAGVLQPSLTQLAQLAALPGADKAHYQLQQARVQLVNYHYGAALTLLDQVRKKGDAALRFQANRLLPRALRRAGRLDRLLKHTLAAASGQRRRRGLSAQYRLGLVKVRILRGEYPQAAKLIAATGGPPSTGFLAAYLAFRAGQLKRAARLLGALRLRPRVQRAARYWLARTRYAQGRKDLAIGALRSLALAWPLDYYSLLARARLRSWLQPPGAVTSPAVSASPVALLPRRPRQSLDRLAASLAYYRKRYPRLARVASLLRWGLLERARRELRIVARDHLLSSVTGARARFLRPISRAEAYRGVRHLAGPRRAALARAAVRRSAPAGPGFDRALWQAFVRLDDPYMANRFSRRRSDHPHLAIARPHGRLVRPAAAEAGIPPGWVWAIMTVESAYCAQVVSHAGALGLLQIMPRTGRKIAQALGLKQFRLTQLFDPAPNIRYGVWYLGRLVRMFHGQLPLAAAAYNGGPHNVINWLARKGTTSELDELVEEIPFRETRLYVKKVVGLAARYAVELGEPYVDLVRLKIDPKVDRVIDF